MCGKFTALATSRHVHDFSLLTVEGAQEVVTYRPMTALPVIIFDR